MNKPEKPGIGLLPLMLELYKEYAPEIAEKQIPFIKGIESNFRYFSNVTTAPVCSNKKEVTTTIKDFEIKDVDLIVIVFIAYATSISALNPLLDTRIPLLLYSTTPKNSMAEGMTNEDILLNHGVHGYMDLANVLKRNKRQFMFVSGKTDDKKALREIEEWAIAASAVKMLKKSTIGIAGFTFDGMGDFGIDTTLLNTALGPEVRHIPLNLFADQIKSIKDDEIEKENQRDYNKYVIDKSVDTEILNESNRIYLGLSKVIKQFSLNAFTMHFQGILENPQIRTLPFLAISKLQEQGLAYAGEGDLLGATGNLLLQYLCGTTLFTETFCPDFDGGRTVMGHMGESNPAFGDKTILRRKKFVFGDALDPVIADVYMKKEEATILNLGIVEDNNFQIIVYTGKICERIPGDPDIDMPYFHFKPDMELSNFLTDYGLTGGTHHIAMTWGDKKEQIRKLSRLLHINSVFLE